MDKIKAKEIRFGFSETEDGVPDANGTTFSGPDAWAQANAWLLKRSMALKDDMLGYLKHDFEITWEDGETYKGRYDLYPYGGKHDFEALDKHVRDFCLFYAGLKRPSHVSEDNYRVLVATASKQTAYRDFLDRYEIGQE